MTLTGISAVKGRGGSRSKNIKKRLPSGSAGSSLEIGKVGGEKGTGKGPAFHKRKGTTRPAAAEGTKVNLTLSSREERLDWGERRFSCT